MTPSRGAVSAGCVRDLTGAVERPGGPSVSFHQWPAGSRSTHGNGGRIAPPPRPTPHP